MRISDIINRKTWTHIDLKSYKRNRSKIITEKLIEQVKKLHKKGLSKRKIEREVGVSRTTVTKILDNY